MTPAEKRAALERSYAASYGLAPGDPTIARLVLADLELVDAVDAAGELRPAAAPRYDPEAHPKPLEISKAEAQTGLRLLDDETRGEPLRLIALDANPALTSEKWAKAAARVGRILEGMGGNSDFRVACRDAAMPELALAYTGLWWHFMTRHRAPRSVGRDHNPFRHRSDADAVRILIAGVYAICDKSTGKLGCWYV